MAILFSPEEFAKLKDLMIYFNCALRDITTRIDILLEDFRNFQHKDPVEHIKTRIKSPESIAGKLARLNYDITAKNARDKLYDIAGLRIICPYARDIYYIADVLRLQPDLNVTTEKDYISRPKPSGYRSYHMIIDVPVYFTRETYKIPVEVQLRTQAMDFWATLEHSVRYKYQEPGKIPKRISDELAACADRIAELDEKMFEIHDEVFKIKTV
ncbi:MAG: GTP pyrophosphokinase family protein [Clostridiales bacterium]|jgi:putative GTP pyrophosphokinase|nr:GTP pyrophosphokinase family protein [Clostridiales bacterium]